MSASITIFQLQLPAIGRFSAVCEFDADPPYYLLSEETEWHLLLDDATRLGHAAAAVAARFHWAAQRGEAPKAGTLFRKASPAGVVVIELGIEVPEYSEAAVRFEFSGHPQVQLPGEPGVEVIDAFRRLGQHADMVRCASPGAGNAFGLAAAGPSSSDHMLAAAHASLDRRFGW